MTGTLAAQSTAGMVAPLTGGTAGRLGALMNA